MAPLASRFSLTFLFALLASSGVALAHSGSHDHKRLDHARRHSAVNVLQYNDTHGLQKRFDNTRFTFFEVGVNACGSFDHDSDFIVALNTHQWDGGSHCYAKITVDYQGKSAGAMITDECEECPYGAIDLSPSLFSYLAGSTDPGQIYGAWNFGGGAPPTQTTVPPKPTSTTHQQPTSTPPPPPPEPTTTSTTHKTSHRTSSSTSSATPTSSSTSSVQTSSSTPPPTSSSTTSSVEPTTTVVSFDTGNIEQFNLALLQLVNLETAIFATPISDA